MIGASIETTLELWASSLREVKKRIRPLFVQERAALNAGLFVDGLLGDERRKTGWMRAEAAGDPGPWRQQAVLDRDRWDADALRDLVRDYATEHLADEYAVLVIDETGFLKQGKASCEVARQYTGSAGKITRLHDWCYLELADLEGEESNHHSQVLWTRGLLIRRNIANGDLAYFTTWCPAGTSIKTLVSVEGHRWAIEDSFVRARPQRIQIPARLASSRLARHARLRHDGCHPTSGQQAGAQKNQVERASEGRPSVPPERLLSALLLQAFYGIRSERQLMEQLDYNLLYRWFVGLSPDDPVWDPTTFTKNRDRLQNGEVFTKFMSKLLNHPQVKPLLSDEHFSVDGTLIEAWASQKSFSPKDSSGDDDGTNFHGQKRKNDTHASTTDPDSRPYRKAAGREAKLSYMGHVIMENRHGLAVAGIVTSATGTAERRAAERMLKTKARKIGHRITAGADKAYDTADHVADLRAINITPNVTKNNGVNKTGKNRRSAIDERTTRHQGYGMSQTRRAMIECIFGWGKQHGTMRKTKHRGIRAVAADFLLNLIAYNLVRIPKLVAT